MPTMRGDNDAVVFCLGAGLRAVGHRMCGSVRLLSQPCSSSKTLPSLWLINKKRTRSGLFLQSFTRNSIGPRERCGLPSLTRSPLTARRRGDQVIFTLHLTFDSDQFRMSDEKDRTQRKVHRHIQKISFLPLSPSSSSAFPD